MFLERVEKARKLQSVDEVNKAIDWFVLRMKETLRG